MCDGKVQTGYAIPCCVNRMAMSAQEVVEIDGDRVIVFDDEYAHGGVLYPEARKKYVSTRSRRSSQETHKAFVITACWPARLSASGFDNRRRKRWRQPRPKILRACWGRAGMT